MGEGGENGRGAGGLGLCAFIGTGTGKHQSARAHSHFSLMRRCLLSFSSSTPYTYIHAPQAAPSRPLFPLPRFSWTRPFLSSSPPPPCPLPRSASHPPTLRVAFLSFPPVMPRAMPGCVGGRAGLGKVGAGRGRGRSARGPAGSVMPETPDRCSGRSRWERAWGLGVPLSRCRYDRSVSPPP